MYKKLENDAKLRRYQGEGVDWLCFNWHQSRSSLLADEMGLGKTVQVEFIDYIALVSVNYK